MIENIDIHTLLRDLPSPYMCMDLDLRIAHANPLYLQVVGRDMDDIAGRYVFDAFPEEGERLTLFEGAFRSALAGTANALIKKPFKIPDGTSASGMREVFWTCHHVPLKNAQGNVVGVAQRALDVTAEVRAERRSDLVARELHHRVNNQLASVNAIAHRTARTASSLEAFTATFEARLDSLARTHQLLAGSAGRGAALTDLIRDELSPFLSDDEIEATIRGPDVLLLAGQVQPLGIALHELSTNAAKYGALRQGGGSLHISWHRAGRRVELIWQEEEIPDLRTDRGKEGFGTQIIERLLPAELGGQVLRQFGASSMTCFIRFDIPDYAA